MNQTWCLQDKEKDTWLRSFPIWMCKSDLILILHVVDYTVKCMSWLVFFFLFFFVLPFWIDNYTSVKSICALGRMPSNVIGSTCHVTDLSLQKFLKEFFYVDTKPAISSPVWKRAQNPVWSADSNIQTKCTNALKGWKVHCLVSLYPCSLI